MGNQKNMMNQLGSGNREATTALGPKHGAEKPFPGPAAVGEQLRGALASCRGRQALPTHSLTGRDLG